MNTFLKNKISKLYHVVSAPVAATRDAVAERLQSVRETTSLLYNRMMESMGHGQQERLKDIMEKEAEEQEQPAAVKEERKRTPGSNSKYQQQTKNNNRMMMMSNMVRLQK